MRVLLLTDSYPPEVRSASHLMFELAQGLRERKHDVAVVTTFPRYNLVTGVTWPKARFASVSVERGVHVVRVKALPLHNVGPVLRGVGQLGLALSMMVGGLLAGPADVMLAYSPPLTMAVATRFLSRLKGAPYLLNVQDLFPQNAIDLGVLKGPFPIRFFERMESWVYEKAALITVHSEGNARHISAKTGNPSQLKVVHNWVDLDEYSRTTGGEAFRARQGLDGKFLVLFAGVMGYAQDLEVVIDAANVLRTCQDIVFILAGDGVEKPMLMEKARKLSLQNVKFLPFVSKEDYPGLVAAADVGLVTLKQSMRTPVVPSKILGYMAASKPFVASLNPESDANRMIEESGCGVSVPPGEPLAMARAIEQLFRSTDVARGMGVRGRAYAEHHFSKVKAIDRYDSLLSNLAMHTTRWSRC